LRGDVLNRSEAVLGLVGYQITAMEEEDGGVRISARHAGPRRCPNCGGERLRVKDRRVRTLRHEDWGVRAQFLAALPGCTAAQAGDRAVPAQRVTLSETLQSWAAEIATMWRFTKNNGITEAFHTKMEVLQRQAYGFRNFNHYRLRVRIMCS
jgi:transposase